MDTQNWKERVVANRTRSAEGRGENLAKSQEEIKARLEEITDRGGVVFVSQGEQVDNGK